MYDPSAFRPGLAEVGSFFEASVENKGQIGFVRSPFIDRWSPSPASLARFQGSRHIQGALACASQSCESFQIGLPRLPRYAVDFMEAKVL
jgi:hypothetical protein